MFNLVNFPGFSRGFLRLGGGGINKLNMYYKILRGQRYFLKKN